MTVLLPAQRRQNYSGDWNKAVYITVHCQDGEPCRVGVAMIDIATGLYAVGAITSALLHRQKTNTGQHIQCNLLSTQVRVQTGIVTIVCACSCLRMADPEI